MLFAARVKALRVRAAEKSATLPLSAPPAVKATEAAAAAPTKKGKGKKAASAPEGDGPAPAPANANGKAGDGGIEEQLGVAAAEDDKASEMHLDCDR